LAFVAVCFARLEEHEIAAVVYGASVPFLRATPVAGLPNAVEQLQTNLGPAAFDRHVANGAAMEIGDAVAYVRQQIRLVGNRTQESA
jgi:hypothetical protein